MPLSELESPKPGSRLGLSLLILALLLSALGVTVAAFSMQGAEDRFTAARNDGAQLAAARVRGAVERMVAAISGGPIVAEPDGRLDVDRFQRWALRALDQTGGHVVALEQVVPGANRATFEAANGVIQQGPRGQTVDAAPAEVYWVVVSAAPLDQNNSTLLHWDMRSDPPTLALLTDARNSGKSVISDPVFSRSGREPAVLTAVPIHLPGAEPTPEHVIGFVTSTLTGSRIQAAMADAISNTTRLRLTRNGEQVMQTALAPRADHATYDFDMYGRRWQLEYDDHDPPNRSFSLVLIGIGLSAMLALTAMIMRQIGSIRRSALRAQSTRTTLALAEQFSTCRSMQDVARVVAQTVPELLRASSATVRVVNGTTNQLQAVVQPGAPHDPIGHSTVGLDDHLPPTRAVAENRAILIGDHWSTEVADMTQRGALLGPLTQQGIEAGAFVPLRVAQSPRALLTVLWDRPKSFGYEARVLLAEITSQIEKTLARTMESDTEHRLVAALQSATLPAVPRVSGLDIVAHHLPAEVALGMGGDWFDIVKLDDQRTAVLVGDITGHGIDAAAEMIEAKAALGALLRVQQDLSTTLRLANRVLLARHEPLVATLVVVVFDATTETISWLYAGHPPGVLRQADGTTQVHQGGRCPMLGAIELPPELAVGTAPFPVGTQLVLYTDGLVERRNEDLMASIDRLAADIADWPRKLGTAELAARIEARLGDVRDDDVAVVVLEATGVPSALVAPKGSS
jgi:serine phosphatase RsbU (regulator of sigma subunit)/CHASE1-domain containing sensor protein